MSSLLEFYKKFLTNNTAINTNNVPENKTGNSKLCVKVIKEKYLK